MIKRTVAMIVLMVLGQHLLAQDWILLSEDESQKNYIKSSFESVKTLDSGGKLITVWTKDIFTKFPLDGKDYSNASVQTLWVIDCKKRKVNIPKMVVYSSHGDILAKQTVKEVTWLDVEQNTGQELVLIKACELMAK